jgi:hypothetical protein
MQLMKTVNSLLTLGSSSGLLAHQTASSHPVG